LAGAAFFAPGGAVAALERGPAETSLRAWAGTSALRRAAAWVPIQAAATAYSLLRSFQLTSTAWGVARGALLILVVYLMLSAFVGLAAAITFAVSRSFGAMWVAQHWAEAAFLPVAGAALALWY